MSGTRAIGRMEGWRGTRGAAGALAAVAVALVCLFVLLPLAASTTAAVREVRLVARDMAFYLDGDDTPNPTIRLRAGEEVRFVLRNLDPGIAHNLAIDAWGLATEMVTTETATTLRVRAPMDPGERTYSCTPHREMMRGVIEVVYP